MSTDNVLRQLRELHLSGMAQALERQQAQPTQTEGLGFSERLGLLLDHELTARSQRKIQRLRNAAGFRLPAQPGEIDVHLSRGLDKRHIAELGNADWIRRRQNLIATGPSGCGKTFIACALGEAACQQGLSVRYYRTRRLLERLTVAQAEGTLTKQLRQLAKTDLLILDDWGLEPIKASQRHDLLEIMEDRHGLASTLIASQYPVSQWHELIGEATLADAILDRLVHNAHRLELHGESMRKRLGQGNDSNSH